MKRTTIDLDEEQHERLMLLARASGRVLGEVVRDALGEYLTAHASNGPTERGLARVVARPELSHEEEEEVEWRSRVEELLSRIHAGVPEDVTPEEIERDITRASEEVRQERIAQGRPSSDPTRSLPADLEGWKREFQEHLARVRSRAPAGITSEEIEREISLASAEVRLDRLSRERDDSA